MENPWGVGSCLLLIRTEDTAGGLQSITVFSATSSETAYRNRIKEVSVETPRVFHQHKWCKWAERTKYRRPIKLKTMQRRHLSLYIAAQVCKLTQMRFLGGIELNNRYDLH